MAIAILGVGIFCSGAWLHGVGHIVLLSHAERSVQSGDMFFEVGGDSLAS